MFDRHFEMFLADVPEGVETSYRLRYQVYCEDMSWEDATRFPDQMERDEYDAISRHFLVRRLRTKAWIAAMRLIVAPLEELPITRFTRVEAGRFPASARDQAMEISRLCVVAKYRRGPRPPGQEPDPDDSFFGSGYRIRESWILLGLLGTANQYLRANGRRYLLFFGTDSLAKLVQRSGIAIEPIGPYVEHRGSRRPYLFDTQTGLLEVPQKAPEIGAVLSRSPAYRLFSELHEDTWGVRRGVRVRPGAPGLHRACFEHGATEKP